GKGSGDDRARLAAESAMSSRLLDVTIDGARGILFNVTGGSNLSLYEINQAASIIRESAHPDVNLIFGAVIDEEMGDDIRVTVIATGFEPSTPMVRHMARTRERRPSPPSARESTPVSNRPQTAPPRRPEATPRFSDLDIPAFLRNPRKLRGTD
ncbi:MAG: cell division protein FtsZ, partial [Anaerolineae bacterium]